ncbi:hypothetical protein ACLIBG_00395 [Virgibacillus sp. W0181]|uniref:hypothetical protein n=1 Tax=Virgibacillus sp. W0181 TaxID=3391581 RepID=UPI003F468FB5
MYIRFFAVSLFLTHIVLSSCQSSEEEMTILDTITQISISKSEGYGSINDNFFISLDKQEGVSGFEEVMKRATRKRIGVNNVKPDYDILVQYEDGGTHLLHLILGDEGEESVLMYVGHEKKLYYVSSQATNKLREIIM